MTKISFDRRRVDPSDSLVEVTLDGQLYSAQEATTHLILGLNISKVKRFSYYFWDLHGIFRGTSGIFRWYFQFEGDPGRFSRQIEINFDNTINYESDSNRIIIYELKRRLTKCQKALENYKEVKQPSMKVAFDSIVTREI